MHSIMVGNFLRDYHYSSTLVAAGLLHGVLEDTSITEEILRNEFGSEITDLVVCASEMDKSLPWKERKQRFIDQVKLLTPEQKIVIFADKICNLEDLIILFNKTGIKDFTFFNASKEDQKWYYTSIYNSLVDGILVKDSVAIVKRLKDAIDYVFYNKEDDYLKNCIFENNLQYYLKLKKLHYAKIELQRIKALLGERKSILVVELCGTPKSGKTTIFEQIKDFFKNGDISANLIEDSECNLEDIVEQLKDAISSNPDIILADRAINDRLIWNHLDFSANKINISKYFEIRDEFSCVSKAFIDLLYVMYAEPLVSVKRDYMSSLSLHLGKMHIEDVKLYNKSLSSMKDILKDNANKTIFLDMTNIDIKLVSIDITMQIMQDLRTAFLECFKAEYVA